MDKSNGQLTLGIIDRESDHQIIPQRVSDGYINATAMCKAVDKAWYEYSRLVPTKAFIDELSNATGLSRSVLIKQIDMSEARGNPRLQGTWVHPQIAINLAQWLSPKFAVLVSQWVTEWMSGNVKISTIPYHLRRYMANMHNVPFGYFSMLNEVTLSLIGPLEQLGYTVSSSQIPDISLGRTFSKFLRDEGYPVDDYPKYPHKYEDGRIISARAYPNNLIGVLREFFVKTWLKDRSRNYFAERDPSALPYLDRFMSLPNYREVMGYIEQESKILSDLDKSLIKAIKYKD
jgi:hypothetical protein